MSLNASEPASFFRTTTFRVTVLAAVLFAASSGLLLLFLYGAAGAALARQTDRALGVETQDLMRAYRVGGLNALNKIVVQKSLAAQENVYLLGYPGGRRLSGNLDSLPDGADAVGDDAFRFSYQRENTDAGVLETRRARGLATPLPGGYILLVGRDVEEDARAVSRVVNAAWTAMGLILVLGVASGAIVSNRFARRIDALDAVARDVMAGDLARRAPRDMSRDELDRLAESLNAMLDRIERLMTSMRHAGDSIAHDLRSPLTRLRNKLDAAMRAEDGSETALEEAVCDADDLLATFTAVLKIARLEAGERRDALVRCDLAPIVRDIAELYQPVCEDAGLEFTSEIEDGLAARADRALLSQAVANLLDNAVKYTPKGGAVALRLRRARSGEAEISVTDTGPGVPADDRERVKQRFVRLDSSRSAPGSGLGLSLVAAVADIHAGRFELDDGPGLVEERGPGLRAALALPSAD